MRVCVFNPNNRDCTLIIKEGHFQEENREAWRKYVKDETDPEAIVWFQDEDPPKRVLEFIHDGAERAKELGYWPDGSPYDDAELN